MSDQKPEEEVAWENSLRDAGVEIVSENFKSGVGHVEITAKRPAGKGPGTFSALGDSRLSALKALHTRLQSL